MVTALILGALTYLAPGIASGLPDRTQAATTPFTVGATIPKDIALTDINGKTHTLGDYRGKVVFIHFWSIVCPYEKQAEPKCIDLQKAYADKGVVQIAINANQGELKIDGGESYANLRDHVDKKGVNFLVTVDPGAKVADMLGGQTTPHCFVIDKDGVLRYAGALDDDPRGTKGPNATSYVRSAVDAVLAGQPVATPTTKPYG